MAQSPEVACRLIPKIPGSPLLLRWVEGLSSIEAENAQWDALLATDDSQNLLDKLAGEALTQYGRLDVLCVLKVYTSNKVISYGEYS